MTSRSGLIDVSDDGHRRTITLNRPQKANALTAAMLADLGELFTGPPRAGERVTVLRAAGRVFSAGLDLGELRAGGPGKPSIEPALEAIEAYPLPVIAAVQGDALAGGVELALHCDFVIAAADASFHMPLARQGLVLTWPLTVKLVSVLGAPLTRRLLLAGEGLRASTIAGMHGIYQAVEREQIDERVAELALALAEAEPRAMQAFKLMIARITTLDSRAVDRDIEELLDDLKAEGDAAHTAERGRP